MGTVGRNSPITQVITDRTSSTRHHESIWTTADLFFVFQEITANGFCTLWKLFLRHDI
jgi:hypothetical protein